MWQRFLDGNAPNPFTNWLVWAGNATDANLPKVHSLSVGAPENQVGAQIMSRMNIEMAALGINALDLCIILQTFTKTVLAFIYRNSRSLHCVRVWLQIRVSLSLVSHFSIFFLSKCSSLPGDSGYSKEMNYGAASPYVLSVGGIYNGELRNQELQGIQKAHSFHEAGKHSKDSFAHFQLIP